MNSLNTPYTAGLTIGAEGFAIIFGKYSTYHTVVAWQKGGGGARMWEHTIDNGIDYGWMQFALKSDIPNVIYPVYATNSRSYSTVFEEILQTMSDTNNVKRFKVLSETMTGSPIDNSTKFITLFRHDSTYAVALVVQSGGALYTIKRTNDGWGSWVEK